MLNMTKLSQWAKTNVPGVTLRIGKRSDCIWLDVEVVSDGAVAHSSFNLSREMMTDAEVKDHIRATYREVE